MPEKEEEIQLNEDEQQSTESSETKPKQRKRRRKRMLTGISKQRRLANERERKRLQVVNTAFISLKNALPLSSVDQKISRIEIVRLAARHIASLMQLLQHGEDLEGVEDPDDELDFCCSVEDDITSDDDALNNHDADSDGGGGADHLDL